MRKLQLLICVVFLGCGTVTKAGAQIPSAGPCYTVESYPQADKRPVFAQFLKEARVLSDTTASQIIDGRIDELYAANKAGFVWGDNKFANEEAFHRAFVEMEQREGKVLNYEYRGQGLSVVGYPPKIDNIYSTTIYAVKTAKWKDGAFLDVRTIPNEKGQLVFFAWVEHFPPESQQSVSFGKNMGVCQEW